MDEGRILAVERRGVVNLQMSANGDRILGRLNHGYWALVLSILTCGHGAGVVKPAA
ncbi:hypothetical protein [Nostoc sp.]|uniref:hypothetical protein n=1 Tax=Nostoc sp. TaxID=1180 RepID=UPI002FF4E234